MAEKDKNEKGAKEPAPAKAGESAAATPVAAPGATKPRGKKTILAVAGMLAIEAAGIAGALYFIGKPESAEAAGEHEEAEEAHAEEPEGDAAHGDESHGSGDAAPSAGDANKIVEVLIVEERLLNSRSGMHYLYETEIWVHVRKRNEAAVLSELEQCRNEIKAEVIAMWRTAMPEQLEEPRMENLTRKVQAMLQERFGKDEKSKEPRIEKALIVAGPGFRVDG